MTCVCRECNVVLEDHNWNPSRQKVDNRQCNSCKSKSNARSNPKHNHLRMYVNGKYIPKTHPLYKPGRYKSFMDLGVEKVNSVKHGYVYIITNPAFPDWVKIGMAFDAEDRLGDYQTGSPLRDYELAYYVFSNDKLKSEKEAHRKAEKIAKSFNHEWFEMTVEQAKDVLNSLNLYLETEKAC